MKHNKWTQIGAFFTTLVLAMVIVMPTAFAEAEQYELAATTPGNVAINEVKNSNGIVYLIPQYHRYPGSKVTDPRNDRAEVAQKQIYKIIKDIVDRGDADLVMVEGELTGEVPNNKKVKLQNQLAQYEKFQDISKMFANKTQSNGLGKMLAERFGSMDREIYLAGAAQVLWAQGADLTLVGAENLNTQKESAKLVKSYMNLQEQAPKGKDSGLQEMLNLTASANDNNEDLEKQIAENEEAIEEVVVNRRNRETAENFANALKEYNEVSGIIQFGAGHTLGLVEELNKQGLTVVTIVPDVVYEDKIMQNKNK